MNKLIVWSQCFIHLSGTIHSTFMFTVFPSLPAKSPAPGLFGSVRAGQTRGCRQRGERWQFCSFPRWSVCDRYTSLTNTAVGFYRIQMRSTSSSRDQLYNHEYLRELAFLSPSLENYCFCCFSKTTNWLCLPLLLLSMSILPCAKWWIYILVLLTDFKSKHLHLGKN